MATESGGRVLIVEDDLGVVQQEQRCLEQAGYTVVTATTADQALRKLQSEPVDLILLGYRLPGSIDGLDFYDQIKQAGYGLPVILVTGFGNEAVMIKSMRSGVRDFVSKAVEYLDYIPEAVERVLKQVRMERQLAESEARLAAIISSAKDAIIAAGANQRITLFNAAAEKMFRCPAARALGQPLTRFLPRDYAPTGVTPEDVSRMSPESVTLLVRQGTRGVRADGEEFPLEASVSRSESGGRKLYTIIVRDISERIKAEERIRQQAALLEMAHDAILIGSMEDTILFWNRGAERLYGWTAAEAVGHKATDLFSGQHSPEGEEATRAVLEKGKWAGELQQVCKDGRKVVVASSWTLVPDEAGQPRAKLIINTDITDKKKLESQLFQAQRMEAIGVLAGGVAHDFNNLLTVINGYSDMVSSSLPAGDPLHPLVAEIRKAGDRAISLTRQLLAFSRKQILASQILDLNALVGEAEKMLGRLIGEDIDLSAILAPDLGRVKADPGQMEQVIMNLVVNARDAMPTGGLLTLETRNVHLDPSYVRSHANITPGSYVLLAVTDTGIGMDEATRAQIFEPFFTTKEVGKGTGLGLATVYGIVKQSGGFIEVYSELGRGTTFKIYLPRIDEVPLDEKPALGAHETPTGTETILLAEDEEGVRSLIRFTLESHGYTVHTTRDGEEALRVSQELASPIHLLITDVVMPKLSGRALVEQLQARHPQMRVLYLSGYTNDAMVRHGVLESGVAFLQKPFAPSALAWKVREVLDYPGGRGGGTDSR